MDNSLVLHDNIELTLYRVARASYQTLNLLELKRPYSVISHVLQGQVEMTSGGQRYRVSAGDVMIHPSHITFSEWAQGPGVHQVLVLNIFTRHHIDLLRYYPVAPVVTLTDPEGYGKRFDQLLHSWQDPSDPLRKLRLLALVTQLFTEVVSSWHQAGSPPRPVTMSTNLDRFVRVIEYMNRNISRKITREELAAQINLHPNYFDRAFHATLGQTPSQMLRHLRLRHAQKLLRSTDLTLEAIAAACGLGDASYFSKVFRDEYGETPGQYRETTSDAENFIPERLR